MPTDHKWYDDWTYEEVVLPYDRKTSQASKSLGYMHLYVDPYSGFKHRLWMYVGKLAIAEDIEKLLDVARRGDGIARGRAMTVLAHLVPDNHDFLRIMHAWYTAKDYGDTIDVSDVVIYDDFNFGMAKRFAKSAYNIVYYPKPVSDVSSEVVEVAQESTGKKRKSVKKPSRKSSPKDALAQMPKASNSKKRGKRPEIKLPKPSHPKKLKLPKPKAKKQ